MEEAAPHEEGADVVEWAIAAAAAARAEATGAAAVGAALASSIVSRAVAAEHGIVPSLGLQLVPTPAGLPAECSAPPPAAFDAAAHLAAMAATFPATRPAAAEGAGGGRPEALLGTLLAQRETIERLERALSEQRAATKLLQQQLSESHTLIGTLRTQLPLTVTSMPASPLNPTAVGARGTPAGPASSGAAAIVGRASLAERRMAGVFSKEGVRVDLTMASDEPGRLAVLASVSNATERELTAVQLMVAVPRYLRLEMTSLPDVRIEPGGRTQYPFLLTHLEPSDATDAASTLATKPFKVRA